LTRYCFDWAFLSKRSAITGVGEVYEAQLEYVFYFMTGISKKRKKKKTQAISLIPPHSRTMLFVAADASAVRGGVVEALLPS